MRGGRVFFKLRMSCASPARRQRGFTLLELLIVITVVGILASIAYPSYTDVVIRNNRAVARAAMSDIIARQESFYSQTKTYASNLKDLGFNEPTIYLRKDGGFSATSGKAAYLLRIQSGSANNRGFTVQAVPESGLLKNGDTDCGTLSITAQGVKSSQYNGEKCF